MPRPPVVITRGHDGPNHVQVRPLRLWLAHRSCISYAPIYPFQIPVNRLPKHPADRNIILIGDVSDALNLRFGQDRETGPQVAPDRS